MAEIIRPDNDPIVEQWRRAVAALERVATVCDDAEFFGDEIEVVDIRAALDGAE
jgi:hypothetical protein